jgi:hypothetical protein
MRREITYDIDVTMDTDGVINECQCECGAGMGPEAHCKHVQAVLWALIRFSSSKDIVTIQTCTEQLQTFHKAKKHLGSPVKCNNANIGANDQTFEFDPRPQSLVNDPGYKDRVLNLCTNAQLSHSIPLQQLTAPANTYALVRDHAYLPLSLEDKFLAENNVTEISMQEREVLERDTQSQNACKKWKEERCKRLHSSNFGRICKATPATDFKNLAYSLTRVNNFSTPATRHGRKYESVAVKKFEEKCAVVTSPSGIHVYSERAYIAATPDRLIDETSLVEVKCPHTEKDNPITPETVPYLHFDGDQLKLRTDSDHYYQVQGQLLCSNRQKCYFVVFTLVDLKVIEILRDQEFLNKMVEKLDEFFNHHFRDAYLRRFYHKNYYGYDFQKRITTTT